MSDSLERVKYLTNLFSLDEKVVLVTGASSGIGYHLCKVYAKTGAHVVAVARRESKLIELVNSIAKEGGHADYFALDLSMNIDFAALHEDISAFAGSPDILINAAGINLRQYANDVDKDGWLKTLDINLSVPFFLAQACVPSMIKRSYGRIINIASLQSFRAFDNGIAYGASKGGVVQLTRAMAQAWSSKNITSNAIAPGFFPTELTQSVFDNADTLAKHAAATAVGRNGEMADLDGSAIFLASHASEYITGHVIPIDGGYLAQ